MRRGLESIVLVVMLLSLPGCGTSPTAPQRLNPSEFDPTALFAKLAGSYTLTFQADDGCPVPPSLRTVTYDVLLELTRFHYLAVHVAGKPLIGDLWALAREQDGFSLRWNVDCEVPDTIGSTSFYICGQGGAFSSDGTISGVIHERNAYLDVDRRPFCATGSHRFVFRRRD
jgi:hypothetical protein